MLGYQYTLRRVATRRVPAEADPGDRDLDAVILLPENEPRQPPLCLRLATGGAGRPFDLQEMGSPKGIARWLVLSPAARWLAGWLARGRRPERYPASLLREEFLVPHECPTSACPSLAVRCSFRARRLLRALLKLLRASAITHSHRTCTRARSRYSIS